MNERAVIRKYLARIGAKGGRNGTGKAKSRGSAGGRKAADARWKNKKSALGVEIRSLPKEADVYFVPRNVLQLAIKAG